MCMPSSLPTSPYRVNILHSCLCTSMSSRATPLKPVISDRAYISLGLLLLFIDHIFVLRRGVPFTYLAGHQITYLGYVGRRNNKDFIMTEYKTMINSTNSNSILKNKKIRQVVASKCRENVEKITLST